MNGFFFFQQKNRKCSIVKEEDENFECDVNTDRNEPAGAKTGPSIDKICAQSTSTMVAKSLPVEIPVETNSILLQNNVEDNKNLEQKKQKQSLCKNIHKSNLSEFEKVDVIRCVSGIRRLEIDKVLNRTAGFGHKKLRLSKTRAHSCSSSESSDDDTKGKKKKINKHVGDTPNRTDRRRDSHDDSSDSQDPNIKSSVESSSYYLLPASGVLNASTSSKKETRYSDKKSNNLQNSHLKTSKRVWLI